MPHRASEVFTPEELNLAATVPMNDAVLFAAGRAVTQGLWEFGHTVIEPVFSNVIKLSELEAAVGLSFYRLLAALRTLCDLRYPYQFQAFASTGRTIFELSLDVQLLLGPRPLERAVEKFHGYRRAAKFSAAYSLVEFYKEHPELEGPSDARYQRALLEKPGELSIVEELCKDLWGKKTPPTNHWSGSKTSALARQAGPAWEEEYRRSKFMWGGLVHGGGAVAIGKDEQFYRAIEIMVRETAKNMVPRTFRTIGDALHIAKGMPHFYDELNRVALELETCAVIDAKLGQLGHPSKLPEHQ